MGDYDALWDAQGRIIDFITKEARQLYTNHGISSDSPNWAQVVKLIYESVVPCTYIVDEKLYRLVEKVLKEAEKWEYKVEWYQEDGDGNKVNARFEDFKLECDKVREWLVKHAESRELDWEDRIESRLQPLNNLRAWLIERGINHVTADQFHRLMELYKKENIDDRTQLTFEERDLT